MARHRLKVLSSPLRSITFFCSLVLLFGLACAQVPAPDGENDAVLNHLNAAISWYRHVHNLDPTAGQPSDALYLENARNLASQALQFGFQSAQAEATLALDEKAGNGESAGEEQQQGIAKALSGTANRIAQTQSQLDAVNKQIAGARGKSLQSLVSQRDALQGELNLDKALQDSLQKISSFETSTENVQTGLLGKINQLKQSVPEIFATSNDGKTAPASSGQSSKSAEAQSSGLFGQTSILFGQMRDVQDIDQLIAETGRLRATASNLQAPLRQSLKTMIQQGRGMVDQQGTAGGDQAQTRKNFDELTRRFKRTSAATVPLRQEIILLDQCQGNLQEWRDSIETEYKSVLRSLLLRVFGILFALAIVLSLSEIWRRATYRYIKDARRRRQLLLVRRFVVGFFMVTVIALGFISEFSSLATFAGFITAGLAVALQTVILSVAAYFFLVGRYGVRVGDRITVGGVTGDVMEVGIVRLYLMELAGTGIDLYPTGRVVVFSNSVLFQAAPMFKQIPGTSYAWHEVVVGLAAGADPEAAERKLLDAVNSVYEKYRHTIERQQQTVERLLETAEVDTAPKAQLLFTDNGLEFIVRYPVEIQRGSETDDQMTRKLMEVIAGDPTLKTAVAGMPKLRSAIKA